MIPCLVREKHSFSGGMLVAVFAAAFSAQEGPGWTNIFLSLQTFLANDARTSEEIDGKLDVCVKCE